MEYGRKRIPAVFWWIAALYMLYCALFTPNFLISVPICIYPIFAYRLFWVDHQPNILFWGMMLQWIPASLQLLYCNVFGITLAEKVKEFQIYARNMEWATWLNIIGVYAFSLGMYLAIRGLRNIRVPKQSLLYDPRRIMILYLSLSIGIYLSQGLIWIFAGLSQFIYILFYLKWGFFLITFYIIHKRAPFLRIYFYGLTAFELVLGLSSFFAGQVIITALFLGLAIVHLQPRLSFRATTMLIVVAVVLGHYLVLWSAVKREYREYVSQGSVSQMVLVSPEEARLKLFELMGEVDQVKYREGIETLVNRLGYIQFFSACLDYVPRVVPHQYGEVYLAAVQHYLVPRFLNPDKEVLDDSKHTSRYTGIQLSGLKEGSSFSLGYIADAYVDFGPLFMHLLPWWAFFVGLTSSWSRGVPMIYGVWIMTGPYLLLLNVSVVDAHKTAVVAAVLFR